jgi:hypothetical protein
VGGFPIYNVPQGTICSSGYVSVQEGKVAIHLILHGELNVGMNVVEVVKEIISLF